MKLPQLAGVIVTSMVIILVVVSVLIPIINDDSNVTYVDSDNTNQEYLMSVGDATYGARITLTTLGEDSATWTVGASGASTGTAKTLTGDESLLWICDNAILYCTSTEGKVLNANVSATAWNLDAVGDYVDFNGAGSMTAATDPDTESSSTRTSPYTWVLKPDTAGSLGFFSGSLNLTNAGSMYAVYASTANFAVGYGTVASMSQLVGHSAITSDYEVSYTSEGTYNTVSGVTVTYHGASYDREGPAIGCIAPIEYVSGTEGSDDIVKTLLNIVPILIIVGIIMAVVGFYMKGRDY